MLFLFGLAMQYFFNGQLERNVTGHHSFTPSDERQILGKTVVEIFNGTKYSNENM
jgi:hypothetical protein